MVPPVTVVTKCEFVVEAVCIYIELLAIYVPMVTVLRFVLVL